MALNQSKFNKLWESKDAFAAPDANNPHPLAVAAVDDAKRRMDQLSQEGLTELGYADSASVMATGGTRLTPRRAEPSRPPGKPRGPLQGRPTPERRSA